MRRIGLVVGLGVPAGIYYYRALVDAAAQRGEELNIVMAHGHAPRAVGYMRAERVAEFGEYLRSLLDTLADGGAEIAAISAATPHICIGELKRTSRIPLVSILDAVPDDLERRGNPRIALFGTRYVIESDFYGALRGFNIVHPQTAETAEVDAIYQALAVRGSELPEERARLNELGRTIVQRENLDAILLAGTDLSPAFEAEPAEFPAIDCSRIHVDAIMQAALRV